MPLLSVMLSVLLASAPAPKPAQLALLRELRACLLDIKSHREAESRCVGTDTSALVGVSRETVLETLGPPLFCIVSISDYELWDFPECRATVDFGYRFYWLPEGVLGHGPQLTFHFDPAGLVKTARWADDNGVP